MDYGSVLHARDLRARWVIAAAALGYVAVVLSSPVTVLFVAAVLSGPRSRPSTSSSAVRLPAGAPRSAPGYVFRRCRCRCCSWSTPCRSALPDEGSRTGCTARFGPINDGAAPDDADADDRLVW